MKLVSERFPLAFSVLISGILTCALMVPCFAPASALAEEDDMTALQQKVEDTAAEYNAADKRLSELLTEVNENQAKIAEINKQLPEQEKAAAESMRTLYVVQQESGALVELILGSRDIAQVIKTIDYITVINDHNTATMKRLSESKAELEKAQTKLDTALADAKQEADRASRALENAKAARKEAEEKAAAKAAQEAAEAERIAAEAAASQQQGMNAENHAVDVSGANSTTIDGSVNSFSVDWTADKANFINEWAGRIDNYLAGSPLAGKGVVFAEAAWDYGVDPRWSPAISYVESSRGAVCFRPHNAWGWGSSSWSNWDEAIRAHVAGLARVYGPTLTLSAAQKYCPPTYTSWYNKVLGQMNSI